MSCSILMIAEKPSLAESISKILSNGRMKTRKGSNNACSVHEFRGPFQRMQNCFFKFTSVCGHVMGVDFAAKYNDWNRVEPIELYEADVIKKEANPKLRIPSFLKQEGKSCDIVVLWLDCDKEGENIAFECLDALNSVMRLSFSNPQTVFRAKFSAITEKEIRHAFNNLILPNELDSFCVEARQEIDLRVGCSFTRLQTKFFNEKYGNLDSSLISYGPCQTPTLAFCVQRHDDILAFEPQPYWVLDVSVRSEGGTCFNLHWLKEREFSRNTAISYLNHVKGHKKAKITKINKTVKSKHPPQALNTVNLLKVCSSSFRIGPHQAMQIAERLYTQGYISYPRTETTLYPASFDLRGALQVHTNHPDYGSYVKELLKGNIQRRQNGVDHGDHPPITSIRSATSNDFDNDTWKIYDFVTRNFIGSISPDLRYEQVSILVDIGEEKFSKTGNTVLFPGFTEIMPWQSMQDDLNVPNIKQGDNLQITDAKLAERRTVAPPYLSESDLIGLMEKNGIGTDASIPQHINNICQRQYVKVQPNDRRLIPTQLGIVLVHGYQRIDSELVLPNSRANVEKILNQICTGERDYKTVLLETIAMYKAKFKFFVENIHLMDELFSVSFTTLAESGKPFSRCGVCRRYMKYVSQKPQRLFCGNCNQTYSLPQNGSIQVFKDDKCPLDNFALLQYQSAVNEKQFVFCPSCYNTPKYSDMQKASPCIGCTDKNCDKAMIKNQVRICLKCNYDGRIVLESWSGPQRWRFVCNRCSFTIYGLKNAQSVKVIESKNCKTCSAWLVHVQFKESEITGCIFCDKPLLGYLSEKSFQPVQKNQLNNRQQPNNNARQNNSQHDNEMSNNFNQSKPMRGRGRGRGFQGNRGRGGRGSNNGRGNFSNDNDDDNQRFSSSRGGFSRGRGRGGSRGRGRGRGGHRQNNNQQSDLENQFKQLTYADFIKF